MSNDVNRLYVQILHFAMHLHIYLRLSVTYHSLRQMIVAL